MSDRTPVELARDMLREPGVSWIGAEAKAICERLIELEEPEPVHCKTCVCGKRAPVQRGSRTYDDGRRVQKGSGTISWDEHLEAYAVYAGKYGNGQSAERLAECAGFGYFELRDLLGHEPTTWRPA